MADYGLGNAVIAWAATSEGVNERVHALAAPLRQVTYGHTMESFVRESLDRSVVEKTGIPPGAPELRGTVRFEDDPQNLNDMIVAGSLGKTLTYYPNLNDPGVNYACDLMAPLTPVALQRDDQRGVLGDQAVELVLRLTTQGRFDNLIQGTNTLFFLRAGRSLQTATFARASSGWYPGRGGVLASAATETLRIGYVGDSAGAARTTPVVLLETSSRNDITQAIAFTAWDISSAISTGATGPDNSTDAWLLSETSTESNSMAIVTTGSVAISTQAVLSVFVRANTSTAMAIKLTDQDASVDRIDWTLSFDTDGIPQPGGFTAGEAASTFELYQDGWYRVAVRTTGNLVAGATHQVELRPVAGSSTGSGSVYVFLPQLEQ